MLVRNTLLYLPAQIIGPVIQFAAIVVFTHWLAPQPYGLFTYVLASQDFVFLLCLSWWSQYTVRYLSDHTARADSSYLRSEGTVLVGTIFTQIAAVLVALSLITDRVSLALVMAAALYTVTRCLTMHLGERARARNQILDYTLAQTAVPIAGFAIGFLAVALFDATPEAALLGYGVAQLGILVVLALRQDIGYRLHRPDQALMRKALVFGLPLIVAGLAHWFGMNSIRILIDHKIGATAMGLIAVGWSLGNRFASSVAMLVTVAAYPLAVERLRLGSREEAFTQITLNGLIMLGLMLPAVIGLYLIQEPLIRLLVAEPFRAMTLAVLPASLAAGLFRNLRTHVVDQIFILIERTRMVSAMTITEAVLAIIGCLIGIEMNGAVGATIGATAGYGVALALCFVVAHNRAGLRVPWRGVLLIALAALSMALAVRLMPMGAIHMPLVLTILAKAAVGSLVYALVLAALFPDISRVALAQLRRFG